MVVRKSVLDRRAALALAGAIAGSITASPALAQPNIKIKVQTPPERKGPRGRGSDILLYREIEDVLKTTQEIWNTQQPSKLREVWDTDDTEPWYLTEEITEPFFSWDDLDGYWNRVGGKGQRIIRWRYSNLRVKKIDSNLALAIFDHAYEYESSGPNAQSMAGQDRCLTVFRRTKGKWRHILYAQCPQGPEAYIKMMRESMLSPNAASSRDAPEPKK
jgi:hypothetical protein